MKTRVNWTIEQRHIDLIKGFQLELKKKVCKNPSLSETVDYILAKVEDPIKRKRKEIKDLARKINFLQQEIRIYEENGGENG